MFYNNPLTIYIISPQPWSGFKVSKHHYAEELANIGHSVFFLNPPKTTGRFGSVNVRSTNIKNLYQVTYRPWFPYWLKFHFRLLFDYGMRRQAKLIKQEVGFIPDVIWDFDNSYQFSDLNSFGNTLKIFHLVDDIPIGRDGDKNADVIFSVAQRFIDRLKTLNTKKYIVPHGLSRVFTNYATSLVANEIHVKNKELPFVVGYVGNLGHVGIDWPIVSRLVLESPNVQFVFIGPYDKDSIFIHKLKLNENCKFWGPLTPAEILGFSKEVDIWLLCYDSTVTVDGATNSHKVLEYLATGKAVISNHLEFYSGTELLTMSSPQSNDEVPALLKKMLLNISELNEPSMQCSRARYALRSSYETNLKVINGFIESKGLV